MTGFTHYQVEISRAAYDEILDRLRSEGLKFFPLNYTGPIDLDGIVLIGTRKNKDTGEMDSRVDVLIDEHGRRVTELLEANNRYLERARAAERMVADLKMALDQATKFIASIAKLGGSE